jgi:hypothetical protein
MTSIIHRTCPNTGKKVLYVEMSYSDYNDFVKSLENDPDLMVRFMKSFKHYQVKYQTEVLCLEVQPAENDISKESEETLLESFNKLRL